MKVIINSCYGGFGLSIEANRRLCEAKGVKKIWGHQTSDYRADPDLVKIVEEMGKDANGDCARLEVIEIPDDIKEWYVDDYDGYETLREQHRRWGRDGE